MRKDKYSLIKGVKIESQYSIGVEQEDGKFICLCTGPNAQTNAQKICDLLNETSRSQGVYPK